MASPFTYTARVNMTHVDAAGLIFFPRIYDLCEAALEAFFETVLDKSFYNFIYKEKSATIIVHSEADYKKPIRIGDRLSISVTCTHIGTTSFTLEYSVRNQKNEHVAEVKTVHVFIDLKTFQKMKISDTWRAKLNP